VGKGGDGIKPARAGQQNAVGAGSIFFYRFAPCSERGASDFKTWLDRMTFWPLPAVELFRAYDLMAISEPTAVPCEIKGDYR